MYKQIIKGKSAYFCDVCGKELHLDDRINLALNRFFKDKNIELCNKHGKIVEKFIKKLKEEEDEN